ncbi:hypothetical protein MSPP1_001330 [Malassezia sp. CBS 17886]|nr:hypothetical protein MSPP1_001330 [Malassezia sp. CBS 17886]
MDAGSLLERLGDAQKLVDKWMQPGVLALPDLKTRIPARDAPYEGHSLADDPWASFRITQRLPIPSSVFETITSRVPVATLALFADIGRACITVENRLYLWDYEGGQSAFEYHELPDDEVILSVGLVPARSGVFIPEIQHVLVLSTGASAQDGRRVALLGVEVLSARRGGGAPGEGAGSAAGGIKLYETAMSATTRGVAVRDLRGTDGGRVFGSGSDQCVYEVVYQAHDGWFSSRCHLRNVTQPRLSNLVPMFFKSEKALGYVAVDSARSLLYVLREGDQIDVYSLPTRDASRAPVHTGSMYGVTHHAGLMHAQQEVGQIVWLAPTEPDTRSNVCLVAVTDLGYRIYFDDFQRRSWAQLAVRIPPGGSGAVRAPGSVPAPSALGHVRIATGAHPAALRRTTGALYSHAAFLAAFASPSAGAQLYGTGPSLPAASTFATYGTGPSAVNVGAWQESTTEMSLGQGASAPVLGEVDAAAACARISDTNGATLRPTATQLTGPPRRFLVLDSSGLTEVVERRPVDVLGALLAGGGLGGGSGGVLSPAPPIVDFFNRFGSMEASVSALALAAQNTYASAAPRGPGDEVAAQAMRLFFGPLGSWPADSRMPSTLVSSKSSRQEALTFYIGCVLRGVWSEKLVPAAWLAPKPPSPLPANALLAGGRIDAALRELVPLHEFMQRHSQLFDLGGESGLPAAVGAHAQQPEREEYARLRAFVQRTIQACHLLVFFSDHGLPAIVGALPADARAKLGALTFADLVAAPQGRTVANELVNALIESQSGARASVDAIADALQVRCASFCSADDVRRYRAADYLRHATETAQRLRAERGLVRAADDDRRRAIDEDLQQSLQLLLASAAQLPFEKLAQVCATYRALGFARGVISLALACAQASDPTDGAVRFRADGCEPADSPRHALYTQRRNMYQLVLDALQQLEDAVAAAAAERDDAAGVRAMDARADAYARATDSTDPLFHEELYTWLIQSGRTNELLQLDSPFLGEFLDGTPVLLGDASRAAYVRRLRDLLWQLYVRNGDFLAAAHTLSALAHSDEFDLRLDERIEYLALAVGNAKSVRAAQASGVHDLIGFATQIEEDLEVAQVQARVLAALQQMDTVDLDAGERAHADSARVLLDTALLDITALYTEVAEPFALLEQQLLIIQTAQYDDADLVARIWEALIVREHNASAPEYAPQAVAALVTDVYQRLGGSVVACPVDVLLARLEQYAFDAHAAVAGDVPPPSALEWAPFARLEACAIPVGWAPLVLFQAGAPPEAIFEVLQGLVNTAPPPWNTTGGLGFLLPDASEFLALWLARVLAPSHSAAASYFPAAGVDAVANEYVLKLSSRKFTRPDDVLDRRIEQLQDILQRVKRVF